MVRKEFDTPIVPQSVRSYSHQSPMSYGRDDYWETGTYALGGSLVERVEGGGGGVERGC